MVYHICMATTASPEKTQLTTDLYIALGLAKLLEKRDVSSRALGRLKELGLTKACTRCGGCGMYGPSSVNGGRCFKCGGFGQSIPTITNKLVAEAAAAVAAGGLDAYFERNRIATQANKAAVLALDLWKATGVGDQYNWSRATEGGVYYHPYHRAMAEVNRVMANQYDVVKELSYSFQGEKDQEARTKMANQITIELEKMKQLAETEVLPRMAAIHAEYPGMLAEHHQYQADAKQRHKDRYGW